MPAPPALRFGPGDARAVLDYDRVVFERYVRRVARLPARGAFRRREIGHQTFFDTLVHVLNVHEVWLVYLARGRGRELDTLFADTSRHPSDWAGFRRYAARVWSGVEATGRDLSGRELGRRLRAPWMPGVYTVRDAILQTTLEQAHHLGEIIGALWQRDLVPPEMTWIDTRRESAGARRRR